MSVWQLGEGSARQETLKLCMPSWKGEQRALAQCGAIGDEDNNQLNRFEPQGLDMLIKGS